MPPSRRSMLREPERSLQSGTRPGPSLTRNVTRIASNENDIPGFNSYISARSNCDTNIRCKKCRRVIHSISHHRDAFS